MVNNALRLGNITSSEGAFAVMSNGREKGSFGKPFYTYIEECNFERKLGRSIDSESTARPLSWGRLVERMAFDVLGIEYQLVSKDTIMHKEFDFWSGSPDANKFDDGKTVVDIKCPITMKSFCQLVEPIYKGLTGTDAINHIRAEHRDGEKYYWQLVSNSILTESESAELIIYCPYKSELDTIREMAANYDGADQSKFAWINFASDDELPWLPDYGFYKNVNVIRFTVPQSDKDALTSRMKEAGKMLVSR